MLTLYGTDHCHLCENAKSILDAMGLEYAYIDIIDDDELLKSYAVRIPVLRVCQNEISWPFNHEDVTQLLVMRSELISNTSSQADELDNKKASQ